MLPSESLVKITTEQRQLSRSFCTSAMMTGYFLRQMEQRSAAENLADSVLPRDSTGGE